MFGRLLETHRDKKATYGLLWTIGVVAILSLITLWALGWYWSREPEPLEPVAWGEARAEQNARQVVPGYTMASTLAAVAESLLDKPGGYLSNDILPPGVWLDNLPNWEFGVLVQIRDLARSMRNDMSRSQSQSIEDPDLAAAEPLFNFDNDSWLFPPSESQYREGIEAVERYLVRLGRSGKDQALFFARADNLREWLGVVDKRLGGLSQRLSASVGQIRINTDLAGEADATQAAPAEDVVEVKTPWIEIDDVFYEARGSAWALLHFLKAAEKDFAEVLKKKNALISLRQIIRELERTQEAVWSPLVLNGSGFGFVTNYSLIMATYISRANAAVIDLRNLLAQG